MSAANQPATSAEVMQRALATIERMQQQLDAHQRVRTEPIAIIGMGCRYPGGAVDPESYWDLLVAGRDAITEVPPTRWDVDAFYDERPQTPGRISSRWGGFVPDMDRFDHQFFGISRREAVLMDPQHRVFLETAWHALEDAGVPPTALAGSDAGVYLAIYGSDYTGGVFADLSKVNAYSALGNLHSIATGRLAFLLDLHGPNIAVDTACSSSLVALHQACQGLRAGETDLALCGAVNAILSPHASVSLSQLNESFVGDGRIKAFDAAADGFVRSEGCGVVVLKRLSDALRNRDRVYALVRGSAVNQDGRGAGLTAPNGTAHEMLLHKALTAGSVRPDDVAFVETHGTGTRLGDPIETAALAQVYGRPDGPPVYLGAVKTNLGHLEAAAGMAGLMKAALCVERGLIPPNLHFSELNPHISFDGTTFAVPVETTPWPAEAQPRFAAVSSFGLGGTNAHVVLEQAPEPAPEAATGSILRSSHPDTDRPCSVLTLSARSQTALLKLARRYQDRLVTADASALADVCHSANTGRSHLPHRLAVTGRSVAEVVDRLGNHVRGEPTAGLEIGRPGATHASAVVFLFSGAGTRCAGMARELYLTQPTFRRILRDCDEILRPTLGESLLEAVHPDDGADAPAMDRLEVAAPAQFAVEYALAQLWRSWGVEPIAVMGHSLGEYVAACVGGVLSLEDALPLVCERARLLGQIPEPGAMAAISAPAEDVAAELDRHDPQAVAVAAVNGPMGVTVSGRAEAVAAVAASFERRGVEVTRLPVAGPGHSPLVEPILEPLRRLLDRVPFAPPQIPWVTNVTGGLWPWDRAPDTDHWCRHTRQPVLFADGITTLADLGYRTFLEIGPGTDLLGMALASLPADTDALMLPSLRPPRSDWQTLTAAAARLYVNGADLDWLGFDRDHRRNRLRLPHYPFDAVRCWHEITPTRWAPAPDADATADVLSPADPPAPPLAEPILPPLADDLAAAAELLAMPPQERVDALVDQLRGVLQATLGYASPVDPDELLSNLGLDSLMAVELRNQIENRLGVPLTVVGFLRGATVRSLAETIVARLSGEPDPGGVDPVDTTAIGPVERSDDLAARLLAQIEDLPDDWVVETMQATDTTRATDALTTGDHS